MTKRSITTRTGDQGTTELFSGETVSKNCPRTRAYGDIDELVSVLGLARATAQREATVSWVLALQQALFTVGAELATSRGGLDRLRDRVDGTMLDRLETVRESLEQQVPSPEGFILPGGTVAGAHLDHARTIARRCERRAVGLKEDGDIDNVVLVIWLNRLSDTLWLLARFEEGDRTLPKRAAASELDGG